jgi:putative ABC transport system permease protein
MGIPLLEGRVIDDRDTEKTPAAVVLGETAARRLFPGGSAVGKRLATAGTPKDAAGGFLWATVVGVVEDVRYRELHDVRLDLYVPYEQAPFGVHHLIVRTPTDPVAMAAAIRREVAALDKDLPITAVLTLDEIVSGALAAARFRTALLAAFAALALLLASVGVYGVMAYTVTERTHEIGVRMALGARAGDVSSLVVAQGMRPALVGIGAGLAAALFLGRLLSSLLFGVTATDPLTFAGAAAVLAAIAFVASYLPARVATRVDPVIALRAD